MNDNDKTREELIRELTELRREHDALRNLLPAGEDWRAEGLLRRAVQEWRGTFDAITDFVSVLDNEYRIVRANRALADYLGKRPEELLGRHCYELIHRTASPIPQCPHEEVLRTGVTVTREIPSHDGRMLLITVSPIRGARGETAGYVHIARDITERRQAEEALRQAYSGLEARISERTAELSAANAALTAEISERRQAEESLRRSQDFVSSILETTPNVIYIHDVQENRNIYVNSVVTDILGYSPEEIRDQGIKLFMNILHPDDRAKVAAHHHRLTLASDNQVLEMECRMRHTQGNMVHLRSRDKVFVRDEQGRVKQILGTAEDITERKRTEHLLEKRLELAMFAADHQIAEVLQKTLDLTEDITGSSIGFYHLFEEADQSIILQQWSSRTVAEFCTAQGYGLHYGIDKAGVWADCVRQRRPVIHNDYASLPHKKGMPEGHARVVRELVVPIFRKGRIRAILGVGNKEQDYTEKDIDTVTFFADFAWDLAERKIAEEKISAALREKEVLLKEIHHRVKNNLQTIASLFKLQGEYVEDAQARAMLLDSEDRIRAMAAVHSLLYRQESLARIDFGDYARVLANQLLRSHQVAAQNISLAIDVQNILLPVDAAIPCGLLLNELFSNSFKHAFANAASGEIRLAMSREGRTIRIDFRDNGVGFPEDIDFKNTRTLGMQLVNLLVRQLDGSIELHREGGTWFEIRLQV